MSRCTACQGEVNTCKQCKEEIHESCDGDIFYCYWSNGEGDLHFCTHSCWQKWIIEQNKDDLLEAQFE